ncbi:hypothetical protein [Bartonella sp. B41]
MLYHFNLGVQDHRERMFLTVYQVMFAFAVGFCAKNWNSAKIKCRREILKVADNWENALSLHRFWGLSLMRLPWLCGDFVTVILSLMNRVFKTKH